MNFKSADEGTAADVIKQINSKNAKIVALIIVLGFIIYHGMLHVRYGLDSCKWLLTDGRYKGDMEWQPFGCMMHHYTLKDTRQCFRYLSFLGRQNHFVFAGDSSIRLLYLAFLYHLSVAKGNESPWWIERKVKGKPAYLSQDNGHFEDNVLGLTVDYVSNQHLSKDITDHLQKWIVDDNVDVIILGSGVEAVRSQYGHESLNESVLNVSRIAQGIASFRDRKTRIMWVPIPPSNIKPREQSGRIINENIDLYNTVTAKIVERAGVQVWWSSRLLAKGRLDETLDGIHPGQHALSHDAQILLNMYCNDYMNYSDGTCCWSAEPYTTLQVITAAVFSVCIVMTLAMACFRLARRRSRRTAYLPVSSHPEENVANGPVPVTKPCSQQDWSPLMYAMSTLGLIMAFFYLCDRTSFFMKENKYYSPLSFWLPVGYMIALGLFFTEDSRYTKVLHRDQTDEWKGWMQLVILIYHMTDASAVLPIYMHIRVLVSAYLFLSGYGHFCYFWQRGDAGIVRFFQVFFRLNFLTVILCLCMNRPYQFYQFTPLISWWVFSLFLLLAIPPHVTAVTTDTNTLHYFYLALKFVVFISIVTVLYMSEVFFEKVFVTRPWKALFVTTDDDIHEWWFRWKLDRYSVSYGMLYALILLLAQRYSLLDDRNHSNLLSPRLALTSVVLALAGLAGYLGFSLLCRNQPDCNEIHPYVVFIPIVSYIVLRNISGVLRTRYSAFFAWFGRMSLELSLCQYHVWLAADASGVLVLVPGYPVLNAIITSFIFICISHEVHSITTIVTPYAVPSDLKHVLRNAIVFTVSLIPIGIHAGMF